MEKKEGGMFRVWLKKEKVMWKNTMKVVTWGKEKSPEESITKKWVFSHIENKVFCYKKAEIDNKIIKGNTGDMKCNTYPALIWKKAKNTLNSIQYLHLKKNYHCSCF